MRAVCPNGAETRDPESRQSRADRQNDASGVQLPPSRPGIREYSHKHANVMRAFLLAAATATAAVGSGSAETRSSCAVALTPLTPSSAEPTVSIGTDGGARTAGALLLDRMYSTSGANDGLFGDLVWTLAAHEAKIINAASLGSSPSRRCRADTYLEMPVDSIFGD